MKRRCSAYYGADDAKGKVDDETLPLPSTSLLATKAR
jgi:hypothetical protein